MSPDVSPDMDAGTGAPAWSYRSGSWFGVFGAATTLLLPASEKARVGELWSRIDDGAGFDDVLDTLLASGLGVLPGFVLVSGGEGPTKILVRGASVRATIETPDGSVELDGSTVTTWVERTLPVVTSLEVTVDAAAGEATDDDTMTIQGGLVRVGHVAHPPASPPADDEEIEELAVAVMDEPVSPSEAITGDIEVPVVDEPVVDEPAEEPAEAAPAFSLDKPADAEPDDVPADDSPATELIEEPGPLDDEEPATPEEAPGIPAPPVPPAPVWPSSPSAPPIPVPPSPPAWPGDPASAPGASAPVIPPPPFEPPPPPVSPPEASDAPSGDDSGADHDGLTQMGVVPDEFVRSQPGIEGQPMAPSVTSAPVATLIISNGDTVDVDRVILIGRAPEARRFTSTEQPRLVTVPSPLHEISSTHIEVRPGSGADHGSAVVTDMGSTNGTLLIQPGLPPEELKPGIAVQLIPGATINLGDGLTIQVARP